MFRSVSDETVRKERVERSAHRFMTNTEHILDVQLPLAPSSVTAKFNSLESPVDKAEVWAIYHYTQYSDKVNEYAGKVQRNLPLEGHTTPAEAQRVLDKVDDVIDQADLIQNYLKKNPIESEMTVYRTENALEDYTDGSIYETYTFKSTSARSDWFDGAEHPIEMVIHLKQSGSKISDLSFHPDEEEYVIPLGTKFNVKVEQIPGSTRKRVTLTEIV